MKIRLSIPKTKEELNQYFDLRWRILREPWSQPRGSEKDSFDEKSQHFWIKDDNNNPIAVARLQFNSSTEAQIRYMAVEEQYKKQYIGYAMLEYLEEECRRGGAKQIILQARDYTIGFYRKFDFELVEKTHLLFNKIQHYLMRKHLKPRVLFICTGNTCRSQMAEGLLRHFFGINYEVSSAGSYPSKKVNPRAVQVLGEMDINISNHQPEHIEKHMEKYQDIVITLCEHAKESCPVFQGNIEQLHWGIPDPYDAKGGEAEIIQIYRKTRDQILQKIQSKFSAV